jgi:hypothetical protein
MMAKISAEAEARVRAAFAGLNRQGAGHLFPRPVALADALSTLMPQNKIGVVAIVPRTASLFATAAVDIWLRAVHSFLISASLTNASPLWASVTGYYSSHYSVRGIAHLLGFFSLHRKKAIAHLTLQGGALVCDFVGKGAGEREHKFYWKAVRNEPYFASDPLFPENDDHAVISDAAHRGRANYADHVIRFPQFQALSEEETRTRVERISDMEFDSPPIPSCDRFPDIEAVQITAYLRIIRFRRFLDEILSNRNRFWSVHRDPPWARPLMDFQALNEAGLSATNVA